MIRDGLLLALMGVLACTVTAFVPLQGRLRAPVKLQGLLKGIDPILTADLLHVLRSAGHGDVIAVVDCNFPAVECATKTTTGQVVVLAGVDCPDAIDAIGSVLPIDLFIDEPLRHICPSPGLELPPAGTEVLFDAKAAMAEHCGATWAPVDRMAFYEETRKAFAIVQTAERRPYGCFLLTKGVVGPDGNDLQP